MSPLPKFQPVLHPQNCWASWILGSVAKPGMPLAPCLLQTPLLHSAVCASSPDACTHTPSYGNKSQQGARSAQTTGIPLKGTALPKGTQHCSPKPSLQPPLWALPPPISHPRGDAPGSAPDKDLFTQQMQSCCSMAGFLTGACEFASVKELKILTMRQNSIDSGHSWLPSVRAHVKYFAH